MSDLQIALILIGIVLLLGVVAFNWWQDKRAKRQMQQHFPEQESDPLFGKNDTQARVEPAFETVFSSSKNDVDNTSLNASDIDDTDDIEQVDPAAEVVIDINLTTPADSVQIYSALKNIGNIIQKPIRIFAQTESGLHRSRLRSGESYSSLQFAVLLADRQGPLTDIDWSKLWSFAQNISEHFEGSTEGPEIKEVQYKAQQLDQQCAQLDAQVGLVIQLDNNINLDVLITEMQNLGFVTTANKIVFPSPENSPYFTVLFSEVENSTQTINRIDFLIDLPNSYPSDNAFSRMANIATELATIIGAKVLSEQGTPLPESTYKAIDSQLTQFYQQLEQAGFPAGTDRAARVFS